MRDPKELLYSKSHEWIDMHEDGTAYIGLTDYAQKALRLHAADYLLKPVDEAELAALMRRIAADGPTLSR